MPDASGYDMLSLYPYGLKGIHEIWVDIDEIFCSIGIAA
jgi:hypothetical protein